MIIQTLLTYHRLKTMLVKKANCLLCSLTGIDPATLTRPLSFFCLSLHCAVIWKLLTHPYIRRFFSIRFCGQIGRFHSTFNMVLHVHTSQTFDLGYNYNSLSVIFCYIPILDDTTLAVVFIQSSITLKMPPIPLLLEIFACPVVNYCGTVNSLLELLCTWN